MYKIELRFSGQKNSNPVRNKAFFVDKIFDTIDEIKEYAEKDIYNWYQVYDEIWNKEIIVTEIDRFNNVKKIFNLKDYDGK